MQVVYSFDDNYAPQAGVSILSLLEHNKNIDNLNIYIIDNHISDYNKQLISDITSRYNRNVEYIELETLTKGLKCTTSFSVSAYGRIFIADVIASTDRIIYIDCDTIINGSLEAMESFPMTDTLVAGVSDTVNPYYRQLIGLNQEDSYICSGVVVINLDLWRKWNITRKCIDFINRFDGNPPHNDQGTINHVCRGHIGILPAQYDVMNPMFAFSAKKLRKLFFLKQYYTQEELVSAITAPIIIHYTDEFYNRPWFSNCTHPLKRVWLDVFHASPWSKQELPMKKVSKNCHIQNIVYHFFPFPIYLLMIRFITWQHMRRNAK